MRKEQVSLASVRPWASVEAEAERTGLSKSLIYTLVREGRFPHARCGGRILLDPRQTDQFLEATSVSPEQALEGGEL